jgi:hypothetical protein
MCCWHCSPKSHDELRIVTRNKRVRLTGVLLLARDDPSPPLLLLPGVHTTTLTSVLTSPPL